MDTQSKHEWLTGTKGFHDILKERDDYTFEGLAAYLGVRLPFNVVSIRASDTGDWPPEDMVRIHLARENYEAGLVEMATGRHLSRHFVLYSFTRVHQASLRTYFSQESCG